MHLHDDYTKYLRFCKIYVPPLMLQLNLRIAPHVHRFRNLRIWVSKHIQCALPIAEHGERLRFAVFISNIILVPTILTHATFYSDTCGWRSACPINTKDSEMNTKTSLESTG